MASLIEIAVLQVLSCRCAACRYLWLPMWAMELSEEAQALAGQRVQGRGELPFQGDSVQLPARLPVAGVDVVVRWMYAWTPQDLALPAVSRFVMP